jgi:hypothetical protein
MARPNRHQVDPMKLRRSLALLAPALGLALSACTPAPQPAPAEAPAPAAAPASTAKAVEPAPAVACPHPAFDTFLKHFGNEITLQEKATADPLLDSYVDAGAEPEPRTVERPLALADVEWPVMPDPAGLAGQGRQMQVTAVADAGADPHA